MNPYPESQDTSPEHILVAVLGMSASVLTETVWALATESPDLLPGRVIVLTTTTGAKQIEQQLFTPVEAFGGITAWQALRNSLAAHGLDLEGKLRFGLTPDDLRVITSVDRSSGQTRQLPDLRSHEDNNAAADYFLEALRGLVENPDIVLTASIAGGRKTMGALLYACMTLIARETDRLTHVLVSEPYGSIPGFYFPSQPGGPLLTRSGETIAPIDALVELADVPFVPLRNLFKRELGRSAGSFGRLVAECSEKVREHACSNLELVVRTKVPEIVVNGCMLKLTAREQLVMHFLAVRAKAAGTPIPDYVSAIDPLNAFRKQAQLAAKVSGANPLYWVQDNGLLADFHADTDDLRKILHSIKAKARKAGQPADLLVDCLPQKGRFSLAADPVRIRID